MSEAYNWPLDAERPDFRPQRLSDEVYGAMVASIVQCWVDVLPIHLESQSLILARRCIKPMHGNDGPWHFGGRRNIGESRIDGAIRHFKDDCGLVLAKERLIFLGSPEYFWHDREQHPQEVAVHGVAFTYMVALTEEEEAHLAANITPKEYFGGSVRRWTRDEIHRGNVHPVLRDMHYKIFG